MGDGVLGLRLGQIALVLHQRDDHRRPVLRPLQVPGRRIAGRRLQKPRQHRRFRRRQVFGGLAEIPLRRRLEPARPCAQIGPVEIDRQNLVLGVFHLHRDGIGDFLDLPPQPARPAVVLISGFRLPLLGVVFRAKAQKFGRLLGDRRAAIAFKRPTPGSKVDADRRDDPARRDAEMVVEPLVLGRDHGVLQVWRDLGNRSDTAKGFPPPGKGLTALVQHGDRSARAAIHQIIDRRKLDIEVEHRRRQDRRPDKCRAPHDRPDEVPDEEEEPRDQPAFGPAANRCAAALRRGHGRAGLRDFGTGGLASGIAAIRHHGVPSLRSCRHHAPKPPPPRPAP